MCEVAVCVGEVGLEFECGAVGLDGLGDVAGVLVHRRQVRVRIWRKQGINYYWQGIQRLNRTAVKPVQGEQFINKPRFQSQHFTI